METLQAASIANGQVAIGDQAIAELAARLRGPLIHRGDDGYDEARAVHNGMINKHPALIAQCRDVADVIACVNFARENELLVAIRGGGHSGPGLSTCEGGLVIDLSDINYVTVDPDARTARVGGGATWGDVDHASHVFGLAAVSGIISTTGVGGLTLGGGHGYLTRKYGLTIDNLLEVEMVLADGAFVTANEKQNADLFWAVRGGGGNFGVVTSFLFRLHPVKTVFGGPTFWSEDQGADVLRWYCDFIKKSDEDMYGWFGFIEVPPAPFIPEHLHGEKMAAIMWCYTGSQEKAEEAFKPVRSLGELSFDGLHEAPYPAIQSAFDALYPKGVHSYWKGDFVQDIPEESIEKHLKHGFNLPSPLSTMHLYPINGAVHRVASDATAWSYRDVTWSMVIGAFHPDGSRDGELERWAKEYWEDVRPHSAGGAYLNFMMEEGDQRIRDTYRGNYDRLTKVKAKYDPNNLFRVNQNIRPAL